MVGSFVVPWHQQTKKVRVAMMYPSINFLLEHFGKFQGDGSKKPSFGRKHLLERNMQYKLPLGGIKSKCSSFIQPKLVGQILLIPNIMSKGNKKKLLSNQCKLNKNMFKIMEELIEMIETVLSTQPPSKHTAGISEFSSGYLTTSNTC